jgi:RNA polymerase sigma-70 factor (ECF subfamily)
MVPVTADDKALVARMLAGQEPAFEDFFKGCFPPLYRFALARMRDADAAEEVVQATLCRAINHLESYRAEAALLTWLCTFCRHEISAYYTRRARLPEHVDLIEEMPEVRAALEALTRGAPTDPETAFRRQQVSRLVQVALDSLPRHYGDALEWKYIDGLSVSEIAGRLGVSDKAAESCLTRARQAFREGFSALGGLPPARQT